MQLQLNKKIVIYFFLFFLLGTLNNKYLLDFNLKNINEIIVTGLEDNENNYLLESLSKIKFQNIFLLDEFEIKQILNSNNLIESYTIYKRYPSKIEIKIKKTEFLANVYKDGKLFLLGSNRKLIETSHNVKGLFNIFGKYNNVLFFKFLESLDNSLFDKTKIKNLYFFKSGRWDIETNTGIFIKLPNKNLEKSFSLAQKILENDNLNEIKILDLRQKNQVILNER